MRKIDQQTVSAFLSNGNMSNNNTVVGSGLVTLHGNDIARYINDQIIDISFSGWQTNTTKSRLNAIVREFTDNNYSIGFKKGAIYLNCAYKPSIELSVSGWHKIVRDYAQKV